MPGDGEDKVKVIFDI